MERSWIGLTLLLLAGALGLGCGTPCQNARARIEGRYAECDIQVGKPEDPPENEVCSSTDATYQKCIADCTESASCEALNGQDAEAGADFGECYADCSQ